MQPLLTLPVTVASWLSPSPPKTLSSVRPTRARLDTEGQAVSSGISPVVAEALLLVESAPQAARPTAAAPRPRNPASSAG